MLDLIKGLFHDELEFRAADGLRGLDPRPQDVAGEGPRLLFAVCLGVWAWERAIEKVEYIARPGQVLTSV